MNPGSQTSPSTLLRIAHGLTSLLGIATLIAATSTAMAQSTPMRLEIVGPAATGFIPKAIDARRRVAGIVAAANAAVKRGETVQDLGPGNVEAMDERGQLYGSSLDDSGFARAVMWNRQGQRTFLSPPGSSGSASGTNGLGDVVGEFDFQVRIWHRNGAFTDLGPGDATAINNSGAVVGRSRVEGSTRDVPAHWENGVRTLLSANVGQGYAIHDDGRIVGVESDASATLSARLWFQGQSVNLGADYPLGSAAYDINLAGNIVGYGNAGKVHALTWRQDTDGNYQAIELDTLLRADAVAAGWRLYTAVGINDRGDIIGTATNEILCGRGTCDIYGFVLTQSRLPDSYPIPTP